MIQLPGQVVSGYRSHLAKRRVVEGDYTDYLKWLRYFHDFCEKHQVRGDESDRVRLFLDKLREKKQSEGQLRRAYNAVVLYFEMLKEMQPSTKTITSPRMAETHTSKVIRVIQTMLGHSSLKTTMIYTHCVPVMTVKEQKSPLDF